MGAFERANGGTIFLDEIGELPLALQANLLGVLERKSFCRVGGHETISIDVRVIAATNRDLRQAVNGGTFRSDLYYRLGVVVLHVPSLRERLDDIPLLIEHFARSAGHSGPVEDVVPEVVLQQLVQHRWPGNVRELRNFVDAAVALGAAPTLSPEPRQNVEGDTSFPKVPIGALLSLPYKSARALILSDFEQRYLEHVIQSCDGNVSAAARKSKIHRTYLIDMTKRRDLK
jgi:transcriptional regulator with PAS, ATPase and Fis domain